MSELWVSNKDQTLAGVKVSKGQIIERRGSVNDRLIFTDSSRWAFRLSPGVKPIPCGTDGCSAEFDCQANLNRHREIVHKPEWDDREQARLARIRERAEAEEYGETIGGHEVVAEKAGPRGKVPYVKHPMAS